MGEYCSVCGKYLTSWLSASDGRIFCSEKCYEQTLPKCCVCGKPMRQWHEDECGKKYCSEKCFEQTLPKCCVCGEPMRQWHEDERGKKYCSEKCFEQTLPKCCVCGKPMKHWSEDADGRKYCCQECYEYTLPKCCVCGKPMRHWIETDDNKKVCNSQCYAQKVILEREASDDMNKYSQYREEVVIAKLHEMGIHPLDILITGVTGAGKSTTLNSIFKKTVAKVGDGVDPETMELDSYSLNEWIRLWDTPGLGDGVQQDKLHSKKIIDLLYKTYTSSDKTYGFIDLVLVIIEGSNRDMGTTYKLLNEVIVPNFQKERILVAINQADMAMKGRHWDSSTSKPDDVLKTFLDEQAVSIQTRVKEATGITILKPVYYSAQYGYNVNALLDFIIDNIPDKKRNIKTN